jgi:hypothetical protein
VSLIISPFFSLIIKRVWLSLNLLILICKLKSIYGLCHEKNLYATFDIIPFNNWFLNSIFFWWDIENIYFNHLCHDLIAFIINSCFLVWLHCFGFYECDTLESALSLNHHNIILWKTFSQNTLVDNKLIMIIEIN